MKLLFSMLLLASFTVFSNAQDQKDVIIKDFLKDVISFSAEDVNNYSPIASVNKIALSEADKSIVLTQENIKTALAEAKNYKNCIITVGTHTVVKITSFDDSVQSGSWGTKMPMGEGYVQKGTLIQKKDYINNIIGIPDTQRRMMFLFK